MRLDADTGPEAELITDLTPEELEDADRWQPITFDDVLDIHLLLEESGGDLERLLAD
jgi:hypothetical protein